AISFLLPLVFGGSIGFEAGLTGLITAGCCWIRDKLKAAGLREAAVADVTIAASISAVFATPLAGIVAGAESTRPDGNDQLAEADVYDYNMRRPAKIVLYTAAAFGAFAGIRALSALFGASAGFPRFDAISSEGAGYLWILLALAAAYLMALLYHASNTFTGQIASNLGNNMRGTVLGPVIAGVALGLMATFFPYVLFPGEVQSHELMQTWTSWTAAALIATGALKALATPMCINLGWVGGNFCPSIFAGAACGYGLAMLTGADPMLMVTVVTSGFLAGVMRRPLLAIAILMLCFPLESIVWMGLSAIVLAALPLPSALMSDKAS
ncbi:MAG: chloride channel protein, partial [Eggerthellaceae bacterium]|nr:chloride channel protein [Eggerthellaceae bacterium]